MVSTVVTRSGQITLNKEFRKELGIKKGDKIIENIEGKRIIISKRDIKVFEKAKNFLPANFSTKKTIVLVSHLDTVGV